MKKRNLDAPTTKKDLIEFAERVITAIKKYTDERMKRDKSTSPRI
ncbi:MAG: hypothetical protein NTY06_02025 [Candidatus Gottesmanbacteria bacterium]|nr:hypothetical protein [Candidatus Gottesmanbacteria bacterium]